MNNVRDLTQLAKAVEAMFEAYGFVGDCCRSRKGVPMNLQLTNEEKQTLRNALDLWGIDNQLNMMVEECAELIKEIMKIRRTGMGNNESIQDELADVFIVWSQLFTLFNYDNKVQNRIDFKFNRLKEKVEQSVDIHDAEIRIFKDLQDKMNKTLRDTRE